MVTGFVFLTVQRDKINSVADEIAGIDGISEVYSVSGRFDLIAVIRARDNEQLADVVTDYLLKVGGIETSETMFAFKVYSRHDLERMFSIGYDSKQA
jgi:DNA-binding Lrp family transcriptional regulator